MKKILLYIFLIIMACGCTARKPLVYPLDDNYLRVPENIRICYPNASRYYLNKDYRQAIVLLKEHLLAEPGDVDARLFLAVCESHLYNWDESIRLFKKVLAEKPDDPYALWGLYGAGMKSREFDDAEFATRKLVKLYPESVQVRTALGDVLYFKNRFRRCIWEMKKVLRFPNPPDAVYNLLGQCYLELNNIEKAKKVYSIAMEKIPYSNVTKEGIASLNFRIGELDRAIENIDYICQRMYNPIHSNNVKGLLLSLKRRYDEAEKSYKIALSNSLGDENEEDCSYAHYAWFLIQRYRYDEAEKMLEKGFEGKPLTPALWGVLALLEFKRGNENRASELLERDLKNCSHIRYGIYTGIGKLLWVPKRPVNYYPVRYGLYSLTTGFELYLRQGNFKEAREKLSYIERVVSDNSPSLYYRALLSFEEKDYKSAIKYASRGIEANPADPGPFIIMSKIALARDNKKKALEYAEKAINASPLEAVPYLMKGKVLLEMNKPDEALEFFKKSYGIDPWQDKAVAEIGKILVNKGKVGEAKKILQDFRKGLPLMPETGILLGEILVDEGDIDSASDLLRPLLEQPSAREKILADEKLKMILDEKIERNNQNQ
ncbi:MAG: tetratricopeptide repeat protein [Candidatus Eremiobacteraeota bacterium]|nr:tetratricopeptide repeat protein [Candidatus Eremiobacteraeota bacterium]